MNVTVENLAPCKKLMRVEVAVDEVDAAFDAMVREYQRHAALPGFRPGKAPRDMVARRFEKDIQADVKKKLIPDSYKKAVEEQKLEIVGQPDMEEIQFGRGQALQFAVTIETVPVFEMPEYKGLPVTRDNTVVTEEDVTRALDMLRERQAKFQTVDRPAATSDFAVVNYSGTCEGRPIIEIAPGAPSLAGQQNFWIRLEGTGFLPGFAEQLVGAKAGETRAVAVDFPADIGTPELVGKKGAYEVTVVEVKERLLPPVDDELAKIFGAESLEKLRLGIKNDLENELNFKKKRDARNQIANALLSRVNFELPESAVTRETRNVVYDIVHENQERGIAKEVIEEQKDQIYNVASVSAKNRVKMSFLLQKVAEKEDIKVSQEEVGQRIVYLAGQYKMTPDQLVADLRKRNALVEIYDQVGAEKTLDFLQQNAAFVDAPLEPATPA